jgi:rare lipoprotein A
MKADPCRWRSLVVRTAPVAVALAALVACGTRTPPKGTPGSASPRVEQTLRTQQGLASYYGRDFHGRRTASGQRFDMRSPVAAHPNYPFGTRVRVTNLRNQRQIVVTIVDRGPASAPRADGVIIDLSQGAAERLAFVRQGRTRVRVDVLEWGSR